MQVRYCGGVTVASPGRSRFHGRNGGVAISSDTRLGRRDGWARLRSCIRLWSWTLRYRRVQSLEASEPQIPPELGGPRRPGEPGRRDADGMIRKSYTGLLHGRAAGPGVRLVEAEQSGVDCSQSSSLLSVVVGKPHP